MDLGSLHLLLGLTCTRCLIFISSCYLTRRGGKLIPALRVIVKIKCDNVCLCVLVAQPCLTLCDPMDCSPLVSSVCGILQARILEWVTIPFSRGSSQLRIKLLSPALQMVSCIAGRFLRSEPSGKPHRQQKAELSVSIVYLGKCAK